MSLVPNDSAMADILELAADSVLFDGLHKGGYIADEGGAMCTAGHIRWATMKHAGVEEHDIRSFPGSVGWMLVAKRFREMANITPHYRTGDGTINPIYSIAVWSDADERTVDDVRDAFLHVAKDLRNSTSS